jgi:hypothetical protein
MQILEEIRYALRQFRKAPGFTATAVLTLALGIGATTAIFTLVHAVLLKSLPVSKPGELVRVGNEENCCINGGLQDNWSLFSFEQYKQFKEHTPGFEELAAMQSGNSLMGATTSLLSHIEASLFRAIIFPRLEFPLMPDGCFPLKTTTRERPWRR